MFKLAYCSVPGFVGDSDEQLVLLQEDDHRLAGLCHVSFFTQASILTVVPIYSQFDDSHIDEIEKAVDCWIAQTEGDHGWVILEVINDLSGSTH